MVGWLCFSPVTCRVSPRRASYFFLLRQKKVTKKKASHVRAASRFLALLAAFGTLAKLASLRTSAPPLNRLRRFPLQGTTPAARQSRFRGDTTGRGSSASLELRPGWLVRCAHLAGCWGCLIPLPSLLSRARHAVPLHPSKTAAEPQTSSFRAQSRNPCLPALQLGCCDYAQHDDMCRAPLPPSPTPFPVFPHSSLLTPHSSPLTPHSSPLIPHPSLLTPHSSPLTPHPYDLTPQPSANGCAVRAIAFRPPGWGPGSAGIGRAGFWGRLLRRGWIRPRSSG